MSTSPSKCPHHNLQTQPSQHAEHVNYLRPTAARRLAATTKSGRVAAANKLQAATGFQRAIPTAEAELASSFPAPLVLPGDDLACDPKCPPQSFRWLHEKERNKPTSARKTLYVAAVPEITPKMRHMKGWSNPRVNHDAGTDKASVADVADFIDYLRAFYHGFDVQPFAQKLQYTAWSDKPTPHIGLNWSDVTVRIRARKSPDGIFVGQLNLEDILDAAIEMLPDDTFATVLLVDHDLYENDEDDFCCGRAYGGSRVAVVSKARYRPVLDAHTGIDHEHVWPASHCKDYVDSLSAEESIESEKQDEAVRVPAASPLRQAVDAMSTHLTKQNTMEDNRGILFSRLARTVSHELGHCLGLDHCVYYACIMQGTAGMAEDLRQPPYLCPVCLSKLTHAALIELQGGSESASIAYVKERYNALLRVCEKRPDSSMFAAYGAWLRARLDDLSKNTDP